MKTFLFKIKQLKFLLKNKKKILFFYHFNYLFKQWICYWHSIFVFSKIFGSISKNQSPLVIFLLIVSISINF